MLFADDSVLFCQATEMEAVNVNDVLQKYAEGFGLTSEFGEKLGFL